MARLTDFLGSLLGGMLGAPAVTRAANFAQAQRLGREWLDEVCDLIHDAHRSGEGRVVETAISELRELADGLTVYSLLESQVAAEPGRHDEAVKAARRAIYEQGRNIGRALVGQPLVDPMPVEE
jgi:hypothetical protein